jgi:hypothetical protein
MDSQQDKAGWRLLANHIGYESRSPKKALIDTKGPAHISAFRCSRLEVKTGVYAPGPGSSAHAAEIALEGAVEEAGRVDGWKGFYFHRIDFSQVERPGRYLVEVRAGDRAEWISLGQVEIGLGIQKASSLALTLYSFKTQRSSGRFDQADARAPFFGDRKGRADVHGGWYDASGDTSKYLTHLSYANFFNPQQTPMAVWNFLEAHESIEAGRQALVDGDGAEEARARQGFLADIVLDEAAYGADFLMRMQDPAGYFYTTVFDQWSKEPGERMICSYSTRHGIRSERCEAGFRQGGGVAIAALARISRLKTHGERESKDYLAAATKGFDHLQLRNLDYLPDNTENIIDDYCALLAATELFLATGEGRFAEQARRRAASLCSRQSRGYGYEGWWRTGNDDCRPFFHAVEEGLPIIALARAIGSGLLPEAERSSAVDAIRANLEFELRIAAGAVNPFGYARELATPQDGAPRPSFFMPHVNETGYWWQGENARLASLAAACRLAAGLFAGDGAFLARLARYEADQLDWIQGLNPFDSCMIRGLGRNNADYVDYLPNIPGGVCNGVTSGFDDESDIAFAPPSRRDDPMENWRWAEQWICHAAWYFLAMALPPVAARMEDRHE